MKNQNEKNDAQDMYETKVNREVKDSLFKFIFGREENKKWLLSLYNAISGENCEDEDEIEINTLENIVYISRKNDVSFLIGTEMYLLEHQSTFNPNLPLRGLLYFAKLYNKFIATNTKPYIGSDGTEYTLDLYGSTIYKIPSPKFYILYNGSSSKPDKMMLRLSDMFETPSEGFEWTATMLNINYGHNRELLEGCKSLQDFSKYVNMIEENKKSKKMSEKAAIDAATDEAIRLGLLGGFFKAHKAEVKEMCLEEFDREEYDKNRIMEGYNQGIKDTKIETARNLLNMGLSLEQVSQGTGLPLSEITELQTSYTPSDFFTSAIR